MESEVKVFHSEISRVDLNNESNLYELLKITPAQPVLQQTYDNNDETWEFLNQEKQYIPRKGSKLKVKTVGDIRALFEKDVYSYLPDDLEKQRLYLLKKIRDGFSYEKTTVETAAKLLNSDTPISRTAWQMLVNINPNKHNHSKQFVLWNGNSIQVNGSRGGKTKFICNYDLKQKKTPFMNKCTFKKKFNSKLRLGLLKNSLNVKFKPGPLGKKQFLDSSHHKYQMGAIELIKLPTPGLEISTAYGSVLEPAISNFINNLRGDKGIISQILAEFAVSALGTIKNDTPVPLEKKCITFDLNYKCGQNRLLMRRNVADTNFNTNVENCCNTTDNFKSKSLTTQTDVENSCNSNKHDNDESVSEIKKMLNDILDSVDISVNQDSMFITEDESRENNPLDDSRDLTAKDKPKRRYCELDKLDVTIIKLPQSSQKDYTIPCGKSFCTLGCVCESIDCPFSLKQHCGVLDCMFGCKCEVSKYKSIELLVERDCSDLIPGLLNLDNEINSQLAKEEKKFHQTVIVSGEKSILLKSQKRNFKSSRKYAEFYSKMNLKGDENIIKIVTVDVTKLNCENIEPFCMVHNLYKCFCKGKFIDSYIINNNSAEIDKTSNIEQTKGNDEVIVNEDSSNLSTIRSRPRRSCEKPKNMSITETSEMVESTCARTVGYNGRKYTDEYYKSTNNKISEMEKNDSLLKKRMSRLINSTGDDILQTLNIRNENIETKKNNELTSETYNDSSESNNEAINNTTVNASDKISYPFVTTTGKNSLKHWLETSYKSYKEKLEQGMLKNSLGAPKKGKASLQSWDFILSRYRERKNIFFVSKQVPIRTFLAVDENHPFFSNCINIDDIRFADLPKYPLIIRNLVTNAMDSENSFCILRGWDHCWELIGSAVKVIEGASEKQSESEETSDTEVMMQNERENDNWIYHKTSFSSESTSSSDSKDFKSIEQDNQLERSKWFVMTVENDFTEIQFYKKGFYVTYDGIQQTIAFARRSGKTVRLSSLARTDKNSIHQFGIYAVPCTNECCMFIGPYEVDEALGIEVVKTFLDPRKTKETRGVWIFTNKVDNMKVLEHPLSFLPSETLSNDSIIHIDSTFNSARTEQLESRPTDKNLIVKTTNVFKAKSDQETSKVIKPIKIQRTNGFYHLSKNILQKLPVNKKSLIKPITINKSSIVNKNALSLLAFNHSEEHNALPPQKPIAEVAPHVINTADTRTTSPGAAFRPVAEIAPQIKIASVYSEAHLQNKTENSEKTSKSLMLILKPEEINKKILANTFATEPAGTDVEKYLESSKICVPPKEILVVSDGDDDETESWRTVFIQCWNVNNFGWLRGRINADKFLSFEFPGFKYSDFYEESEAFEKINQVLARKIYIPKNCKLQWQVILDEEYLTCDMLTPACLEDKKYLLIRLREHRERKTRVRNPMSTKLYTKKSNFVSESTTTSAASYFNKHRVQLSKRRSELADLEQASRELEQQSEVLWKRAVKKREEIIGSLGVSDSMKVNMTEKLQNIMSMNKF